MAGSHLCEKHRNSGVPVAQIEPEMRCGDFIIIRPLALCSAKQILFQSVVCLCVML